ncbi:MAG: lactate utilization protein [Clostridia bacterium]|nr:lactate utilization protein [Clostridia bacterium]
MSIKQVYYDKAGMSAVKAFIARGFDAHYCKSAIEAKSLALSLISSEDSVAWGGSVTIDTLGLKEALYARGNKMLDREKAETPEERTAIMREGLLADTFLMSANALSADGQMVNIDGTGNRVAALCYGPKHVIVIAGMNKLCPTLNDAMVRARNTAAPMNSQRFPSESRPCYLTGKCADCKVPDTICTQTVITRYNRIPGRIKLILVGEELGM